MAILRVNPPKLKNKQLKDKVRFCFESTVLSNLLKKVKLVFIRYRK